MMKFCLLLVFIFSIQTPALAIISLSSAIQSNNSANQTGLILSDVNGLTLSGQQNVDLNILNSSYKIGYEFFKRQLSLGYDYNYTRAENTFSREMKGGHIKVQLTEQFSLEGQFFNGVLLRRNNDMDTTDYSILSQYLISDSLGARISYTKSTYPQEKVETIKKLLDVLAKLNASGYYNFYHDIFSLIHDETTNIGFSYLLNEITLDLDYIHSRDIVGNHYSTYILGMSYILEEKIEPFFTLTCQPDYPAELTMGITINIE